MSVVKLLVVFAVCLASTVAFAGVPGGGLWGGQSPALGQRHERHGGSHRSTLPRGYQHQERLRPSYGAYRGGHPGYPLYVHPYSPGVQVIILR